MNKSRIVILVVLLLCLAGLGGMYVMNLQKFEDLKRAQEQSAMDVKLANQEKELEMLRKKNVSPFDEAESGKETPSASSSSSATAPVPSSAERERIKALEAEVARLKNKNELVEEENSLIATKDAEKNNNSLKEVNQVMDARVVGKVSFYDRGNNLLIFQPVGQPNLKNGEELAIRRRGAIYVTLVIEELDPETGAYSAEIKRNELYDADKDDSVHLGDEVIIPPATVNMDLPDLKTNQLNTKLPPIPMEPDFTPAP